MGYTIDDNKTVFDAVQRFSAYNVGALVTVDDKGKLSGVISERDYINKIALLGRTSKETPIKAIATMGAANLIVATKKDTIQECMSKMLAKDIRHLPRRRRRRTRGNVVHQRFNQGSSQREKRPHHPFESFCLGQGRTLCCRLVEWCLCLPLGVYVQERTA